MMHSGTPSWLRRKEASRYLKEHYNISRTSGTLAKLASLGGGPKFQHVGRIPMYPIEALDEWAQGMFRPLVANTTEAKLMAGVQYGQH
jgi:hypothetical protein